ncbi:hypothetical protein [Novosphingobium sediminis]|nr:hypothetical protein [Novosphingobium sediminis]
MRLLLVLFVLLSGLSLPEMGAVSARAEVVAPIAGNVAAAAVERQACAVSQCEVQPGYWAQSATLRMPNAFPVSRISISISDRPRE